VAEAVGLRAAVAAEDAGDNVMKIFLPCFAVLTAWSQLGAQVAVPLKSFETPDAAAKAAIAAVEQNDTAAMNAIFGPNSKGLLSSGDAKQDAEERAQFARVARSKYKIEKDPMDHHRAYLDIGPEDWPFPVPIVERSGKWSFEPEAGRIELRARRIGANEIDTIEQCAGFVAAQRQYAEVDRDKDGILEYAEYLMATPGKEDGLYSAGYQGVPKKFAESEIRTGAPKAVPYHGYYFHVLTTQTGSYRSVAHSSVVKDKHMMGGFALVAWPAEYGVTGIHSFIVNQDGVVYEKDLKKPLSNFTPPVRSFSPDKTWTRVDE
jgi:hypothetical protein